MAAAPWVIMRFALEGLDAKAGTLLAKAQAPTLTTVHGLTGSHRMKLIVPAGELGDEEVTMRWQEMKTELVIGRRQHRRRSASQRKAACWR